MNWGKWFNQHSIQYNPEKYGTPPPLTRMSTDEYQEYLKRQKAIPNTIPDTREEERYQAFKARLLEEMDIKE